MWTLSVVNSLKPSPMVPRRHQHDLLRRQGTRGGIPHGPEQHDARLRKRFRRRQVRLQARRPTARTHRQDAGAHRARARIPVRTSTRTRSTTSTKVQLSRADAEGRAPRRRSRGPRPRSSRSSRPKATSSQSFLEGLTESFLAEPVTMPPGAQPATKSRFEMLLVAQGARDAPPGAADGAAADDRPGAAPDAPDAGTHGAGHAAPATGAARMLAARFRFNPKALAFLRALKRNNDREWFQARKEQYELLLRAPMIEIDRAARGRLSGRSRRTSSPVRKPRSIASIATRASRRTRRRSRRTSRRCFRAAASRSIRAPDCTSRSRPTGSGSAAACTRRTRPQLHAVREHIAANLAAAFAPSSSRRRSGARRDRSRRAAAARAARFPNGSPGGRVPEVPPVPRRPRVPGGVRYQPALLRRRPQRLPPGRAAHRGS